MAALLAALGSAFYAAGLVVAARFWYQRIRPSAALTCGKEAFSQHYVYDARYNRMTWKYPKDEGHSDGHFDSCHTRWGCVETTSWATWYAFLFGLVWLPVVVGWGLARTINGGHPELEEERAARLRALREGNDKLERELQSHKDSNGGK